MKAICFFLPLILCVACSNHASKKAVASNTVAFFDTSNTAILQAGSTYFGKFKNLKNAAIEATDVQLINAATVAVVQAKGIDRENLRFATKFNMLTLILRDYRRQVVCYINEQGQRVAWVNCFCTGMEVILVIGKKVKSLSWTAAIAISILKSIFPPAKCLKQV